MKLENASRVKEVYFSFTAQLVNQSDRIPRVYYEEHKELALHSSSNLPLV